MNVMPIGGKSPSSTVKGVSVDADGNVNTKKTWGNEYLQIMQNESIRDTSAHTTNVECNCSGYAMVSIRIKNSLDKKVQITLLGDTQNEGTYWLKDINGDYIQFDVEPVFNSQSQAVTSYTIITPDDIPALKYLGNLRLRVAAYTNNAPTTGDISIGVFRKR